MSRAFVSEPGASTLVRSSEESARNTAEVYRTIEPQFNFEVRQGRNGWMIARLRKEGRHIRVLGGGGVAAVGQSAPVGTDWSRQFNRCGGCA